MRGSQVLKKGQFGCLYLGDNLVADGLIFGIPVKAFGGLEMLVEMFLESDVVSNVTINPKDWTIEVN